MAEPRGTGNPGPDAAGRDPRDSYRRRRARGVAGAEPPPKPPRDATPGDRPPPDAGSRNAAGRDGATGQSANRAARDPADRAARDAAARDAAARDVQARTRAGRERTERELAARTLAAREIAARELLTRDTPVRETPAWQTVRPQRERRLDQPRERRRQLPRFDQESFGRWAEAIARFMGTARFLVYMTVVILIWIGWNTVTPRSWRFDPYTFTFLTLVLSLQASYAAPLILLAQNRQADRDRLAMEEDRRRAAMQKADTEYLAREIAALRIALGEVATRDFLRGELNRFGEELTETLAAPSAVEDPPAPARTPRREPQRMAREDPQMLAGAAGQMPPRPKSKNRNNPSR